ncbi:FG-GAP-like repeat-containing protein [Aeromicrobium sp. UC242_57]
MRAISSEQGPGFQIKLVPNFRGDGVDRWVGTNHLSHPETTPPGGVFELTPTSNLTQPWTAKTIAGPFSPRAANGQAAPGVFGSGDLDGDGDIDLTLSGDGDRRLFWIEQTGTGAFKTHVLEDYDSTTTSAPGMGQSGGAVVADFDGNGTNEMAFGSFDQNTVAIYARHGGGAAATGTLKVSGSSTAAIGAKTTLAVDLTGVTGTTARSAQVTFKTARTGAVKNVGNVSLVPTSTAGRFAGSIKVSSTESGTYTVTSGAAKASTVITTRSAIKDFSTSTKKLKKKQAIKSTVTVSPGFSRKVQPRSGRARRPRRSAPGGPSRPTGSTPRTVRRSRSRHRRAKRSGASRLPRRRPDRPPSRRAAPSSGKLPADRDPTTQ